MSYSINVLQRWMDTVKAPVDVRALVGAIHDYCHANDDAMNHDFKVRKSAENLEKWLDSRPMNQDEFKKLYLNEWPEGEGLIHPELRGLRSAKQELDRQRALVDGEMDALARNNQLWTNGQCKAWPAYETALGAYQAQLERLLDPKNDPK